MKKYCSHLVLGFLILIIMGPSIWSSGGILLLDYVATDHTKIQWLQNGWFLIPQIPTTLLGYVWGTKISFFFILLISTYLGVLFARSISDIYTPKYRKILEVFGGAFFLLNPFAYERMMVQPVIYLGVIFLGYVIYFLLFSVGSFGLRKAILVGIFASISLNLFLHASYMILFIFGLFSILFLRSWKEFAYMFLSCGIVLILNLNWLLAGFFGVQNSVQSIQSFSPANLQAFQTQTIAPLDVISTNVLLYGFWGERYGTQYVNISLLSSLWYIAGGIIFLLVCYGFLKIRNSIDKSGRILQKRKVLLFVGGLGFLSLVFGVGIASPLTSSLTHWMIDHVPLWQGYREPQKWIGILMIIEGIGFLFALAFLFEKYGKDIVMRISLIVSVFLIFIIWSPGALFGYHSQLRTTIYPEEFNSLRTNLLSDSGTLSSSGEIQNTKILALPWHSYIGCTWMGVSPISNPIQGLLAPLSVVSSDNIEVGNILYTNSTDTQSQSIELFLRTHNFNKIKKYNFSHILLMKQCADFQRYHWIDSVSECKKQVDNSTLSLYKCS